MARTLLIAKQKVPIIKRKEVAGEELMQTLTCNPRSILDCRLLFSSQFFKFSQLLTHKYI